MNSKHLRYCRWMLALVSLGCAPDRRRPHDAEARVALVLRAGSLDRSRIRASPAHRVRSIYTRGRDAIVLELSPLSPGETLRVEHPDACPLELSATEVMAPQDRASLPTIEPVIAVEPPAPPLGFDAPFSVRLSPRCGAHPRARWSIEPANAQLSVASDTLAVTSRTPASTISRTPTSRPAIAAISYAEQGRVTVTATVAFDDRAPITARFERVAAARSTGVASITPHQRVALLGGAGPWTLEAPANTRATLTVDARGTPWFEAETFGAFWLSDSLANRIRVSVSAHDDATLDCARSECHQRESRAWERTAMATAFARALDGTSATQRDPRCASACHTLGEPALDDGGFHAIARALAWQFPAENHANTFAALPGALARAATIGCTSCHGPAALPTPDQRWSITRSAVCATCHDAPPRYAHTHAWNSTAMARAASRTTDARCLRCHDTDHFLRSLGLRTAALSPPAEALTGLDCAACHAVHSDDALPRLLRRAPLSPALAALPRASTDRWQPCVTCHTAESADVLTAPSAATLTLAEGSHREAPRGCVTCHAGASDAVARGSSHSFAVNRQQCARCHSARPFDEASARRALRERSEALLRRLVTSRAFAAMGEDGRAPHASGWALRAGVSASVRRAAALVLAVIEDRGAWAHNAQGAQRMLTEAEHLLTE